MKKTIFMLAFAGAALFTNAQTSTATPVEAAPQTAPDPNAPDFKWESTTIDYGSMDKGGNGEREFKFANAGKSPLIISSCRGSCGCTVPTCPTEPIMPGQKGTIKVKYDTQRVGPFTKTITVNSNAKNNTETLKITGTISDPAAGTPGSTAPAGSGH